MKMWKQRGHFVPAPVYAPRLRKIGDCTSFVSAVYQPTFTDTARLRYRAVSVTLW